MQQVKKFGEIFLYCKLLIIKIFQALWHHVARGAKRSGVDNAIAIVKNILAALGTMECRGTSQMDVSVLNKRDQIQSCNSFTLRNISFQSHIEAMCNFSWTLTVYSITTTFIPKKTQYFENKFWTIWCSIRYKLHTLLYIINWLTHRIITRFWYITIITPNQ